MTQDLSSQSSYLLAQGAKERERLNAQQQDFEAIFAPRKYIYVCGEHVDVSQMHNILDVATGSGVWLQGLWENGEEGVRLPPDAQMTGCDLTLQNINEEALHLANFTFFQHDVRQPFPASEHDKYDLINMRLVMSAFGLEEYAKVIAHLAPLLKKDGGVLQLVEFDPVPSTQAVSLSSQAIRASNTLKNLYAKSGMNPRELCQSMKPTLEGTACGLRDVRVDCRPWYWGAMAGEHGLSEKYIQRSVKTGCGAFHSMKGPMIQLGIAKDEVDFAALANDVEEWLQQEGFASSVYVGSARSLLGNKI